MKKGFVALSGFWMDYDGFNKGNKAQSLKVSLVVHYSVCYSSVSWWLSFSWLEVSPLTLILENNPNGRAPPLSFSY